MEEIVTFAAGGGKWQRQVSFFAGFSSHTLWYDSSGMTVCRSTVYVYDSMQEQEGSRHIVIKDGDSVSHHHT
jgi:hypothetical protein